MSDLADLSATQAIHRMRQGTLRAEDLLEACLARVAAREPVVHAFVHHDPALLRAAKPASGALAGLPLGVKDVIDTTDQPSQYGSPIWAGYQPRADAACVAWARSAGAVVMGKTVTTEFATRTPGGTANPHNPAHTPGGSSSGSAAGVAAGFFPLAFGTQTAGSIIRPAAYCGVVGFKPSFGSVPRLGMKVMSESLDTIGAIARTVADCALLVGAVSGLDLGNPDARPDRAPRIGICPGPYGAVASAETRTLLDAAATKLAAAGAVVLKRPLPDAFSALVEVQPLVMNAESAQSMGWELAHHRARLSPVLQERLVWGAGQWALLDGARQAMRQLQDAFEGVMEDVDILLTPSAPGEAPLGLHSTGEPVFNGAWTALHVPCVTIPAGFGPAGLPLGLQMIGARQTDRATLAWSQWVAAALG